MTKNMYYKCLYWHKDCSNFINRLTAKRLNLRKEGATLEVLQSDVKIWENYVELIETVDHLIVPENNHLAKGLTRLGNTIRDQFKENFIRHCMLERKLQRCVFRACNFFLSHDTQEIIYILNLNKTSSQKRIFFIEYVVNFR